MSALVVAVINYGSSYSGYEQEVSKSIFYLIDEDSGVVSRDSSPIRIPDSGTSYSYEKYIRCRTDIAPATKCFNFLVWYLSGTIPSGQGITINSDVVSEYTAPVNSPSVKGTRVDFTTKNSEVNSIALSGELTGITQYTSYLVFQLLVTSAAEASESEISFVIQYDEV